MPNKINRYIEEILKDESVKKTIDSSILNLATKIITSQNITNKNTENNRIIRLCSLLINYIFTKPKTAQLDNIIKLTILLLKSLDIPSNKSSHTNFQNYLGIESLSPIKTYYFYIAALGLISNDIIRTRIDLKYFECGTKDQELNWKNITITGCIDAFILLIRKDNGFGDINTALTIINKLKNEQSSFEEKYINNFDTTIEKISEAYKLLGIYHISKILVETSNYLINGYNYKSNLTTVINIHLDQAQSMLNPKSHLSGIASIISQGCMALQKNSIWFSTQNLGSNIEKLCSKLANQNIIDLLPSQQEAIEKNLLDSASNVTVVQMPTSAGKTLLAEFSILQTLSLKPDSKIVYVVPTRSLMNQIYFDLKKDFEDFNYVIEKTSKVNEIDPSEDIFLKQNINILVTTPEKLDLLIRRDHPSVNDISLIVIDEAHNLTDGLRGAKLELLLVILKRERSKARYLLLSPFMSNACILRDWLSEGKTSIDPIIIDWKPSEKLLGGIKENNNSFYIELLPSAHSFEYVKNTKTIEIQNLPEIKKSGKKDRMFEIAYKRLADKEKSNLYLCRGPKSADKKAKEIADNIETNHNSFLTDLVSRFIEEEVGEPTILSQTLKKRVAVHHAGLTEESRLLVEHLIRKKEITHVCATTTIAQGINFPISTIYIDDMRKGDKELDINDFLNIAGRAGRTMVDRYGKVFFPFNTHKNETKIKHLLKEEASEITSALTEIIYNSENIIETWESKENGKSLIFRQNESLTALVQYLVHLLNILEENTTISEIDSFFKDSLGYYSLKEESQKIKFINLCRKLFEDLKSNNTGILKYADKTGFSVPSVLKIMSESKNNRQISDINTWNPDVLFNEKTKSLSEKIAIVGKLREVELGSDSDKAPFNPEIIAKILINWVNGKKINSMINIHPAYGKSEDKINDFIKYLNSLTFKASWGMSALEGITLGNEKETANISYIPSMIYFGVNSQEAVSARMIGIPRTISTNVSNIINPENQIKSLSKLRENLNSMTKQDWETITPANSRLNGAEWKQITEILVA